MEELIIENIGYIIAALLAIVGNIVAQSVVGNRVLRKVAAILCTLMVLLLFIASFVLKIRIENKNANIEKEEQEKIIEENEDFDALLLEINDFNFDMKRQETIEMIEEKGMEFEEGSGGDVAIQIKENGMTGRLSFFFDEKQNLHLISYKQYQLEETDAQFEEKQDNILSELDYRYGERRKVDGAFCYENAKSSAVTYTPCQTEDGEIKFFYIKWYDSNYYYEKICPEQQ